MLPVLLDIMIPAKLEAKYLRYRYIGFIVILPYRIYGSGVSHRYNAKIVVSRIVIARVYCMGLGEGASQSLTAKTRSRIYGEEAPLFSIAVINTT